MGKPQARQMDPTVHAPIVNSGSPDTTVCSMPAARLHDVTLPCPLCKTPPGKIVTSSSKVFINRLGAARLSDKVACGAGGGPPGGCSHPSAKGYSVRPEDSYEQLMKGEHEADPFNELDEVKPEKLDGSRKPAEVAVGIPPGGASAARPEGATKATAAGSLAEPYDTEEYPNPWGPDGAGGMRKNSAELQGGDIRADIEHELTGRHSIGVGENSVGAKINRIDKGNEKGKKKSWFKRLLSFGKDEDGKRFKITINLLISIELSFGKRSGQAGYGGAANAIAMGCPTVIVG